MCAKKKFQLKVLFDTNTIWNSSPTDLFRKEIVDLIGTHKNIPDLEVSWYLADTVVQERFHQMSKAARELLPNMQKMERLLGHQLGITADILEERVKSSLHKQLQALSIQTVKLDLSKILWEQIIHRSLSRKPPFEDGTKEKGFRDSLVLEALKQLIEVSPKASTACRIIFVTGDVVLTSAAVELIDVTKNLSVHSTLDQVVSYINILGSTITSDLVATISSQADTLFYEEDSTTCLYETERIEETIEQKFASEIEMKPDGADRVENATWWINDASFEKKDRQRIHWKNTIELEVHAFGEDPSSKWLDRIVRSNQFLLNPTFASPLTSVVAGRLFSAGAYNVLPESARELLVSKGIHKFDVLWSVTLSTNQKLKIPKIHSINYVSSSWESLSQPSQ